AREILRVELLGRRHLPEHRAKLRFQLEHAAREETLDRLPGLRQHAAVGWELRTLEREHEIVRGLSRPFAKALRLLRPVEGGVDLDRGEPAAGVLELTRLRQPLGIERAAPRLEYPAADADTDHVRVSPAPLARVDDGIAVPGTGSRQPRGHFSLRRECQGRARLKKRAARRPMVGSRKSPSALRGGISAAAAGNAAALRQYGRGVVFLGRL